MAKLFSPPSQNRNGAAESLTTRASPTHERRPESSPGVAVSRRHLYVALL